jgi:hypothetical protein
LNLALGFAGWIAKFNRMGKMTVAELIKQLEKMPQSMRVILLHCEEGYNDTYGVSDALISKQEGFGAYRGRLGDAKPEDTGAEIACLIS